MFDASICTWQENVNLMSQVNLEFDMVWLSAKLRIIQAAFGPQCLLVNATPVNGTKKVIKSSNRCWYKSTQSPGKNTVPLLAATAIWVIHIHTSSWHHQAQWSPNAPLSIDQDLSMANKLSSDMEIMFFLSPVECAQFHRPKALRFIKAQYSLRTSKPAIHSHAPPIKISALLLKSYARPLCVWKSVQSHGMPFVPRSEQPRQRCLDLPNLLPGLELVPLEQQHHMASTTWHSSTKGQPRKCSRLHLPQRGAAGWNHVECHKFYNPTGGIKFAFFASHLAFYPMMICKVSAPHPMQLLG